MRSPKFNSDGVDKVTFAPVELINALDSEWKDVRLSFTDWGWLKRTYGSDSIDDYYLNGYSVQGLVKACRLHAGLEPEADGIDYNSEGDACYIHFANLDDAVETAQLVVEMLNDRSRLVAMIEVARENDFEE